MLFRRAEKMTEEDTFNRLRRPTYDEISRLVGRLWQHEENTQVLEENHWTWDEYWAESSRRWDIRSRESAQ